jgi:hypothetical protein
MTSPLDRQHIFFEGKKLQDQLLLVGLVGQLQPCSLSSQYRIVRAESSDAHRLGLIPPQATCVALFDWDGNIPVRGKFPMPLCALIKD